MSELTAEVYGSRIYNRVVRAKEEVLVALGIIITELVAHNQASMQAGAGIAEHIEKALPSAFASPNIGADVLGIQNPAVDKVVDIGIEAGPAVASIALLKNAPGGATLGELGVIFATAQGLAEGGDAALAHEHLLSQIERHTPDNGFSAVYVAYFTKWIFDLIGRTESQRLKRIRQVLAGAAAGGLIIAASLIDKHNMMTDTVSHVAGAVTGAGASALDQRGNRLQDDAAAQDFEPAIENG